MRKRAEFDSEVWLLVVTAAAIFGFCVLIVTLPQVQLPDPSPEMTPGR